MSNFGKSIGKYVATATVFGLVSGTVFTGVCYTGNKYLNNTSTPVSTESSSSSGNITTNSKSNSSSISSVSDIVDEVMPSIVAITNTSTVNYQNFMGGRQQ